MGWFERRWKRLSEEEKENEYIKFSFGLRDLNSDKHWREAPENFSFLDKRTILILPGSGTNSAEAANGMCKIAENMLPEEVRDSWQICSMHYGNSYNIYEVTVIRAQRMFDKYFIPLIASKDKNDDLHRLPTNEAMQNMRNLVVFTHCYGGYIMNALEQQLKQTMQDLSYSPEEQALIQKQLFVIQHNNIERDLGDQPTATTQLVRISQQDDERYEGEMKYGTFSHFLATHSIPDDNVSYLKISDNQRILYAKRITKETTDEHNGGYWQDKTMKSSAGIKEEEACKVIFDEVVSSNYPIENMEQIIKTSVERHPEIKDKIQPNIVSGKLMTDDYNKYSHKFNGTFNSLVGKVVNDDITRTDILMTNTDCCFMQDKDGHFLMDYLLEHKKFDLAQVLFHKISKIAKVSDYDNRLSFEGSRCQNKSDAVERTKTWGQIAINENQPEFFAEMAKIVPNLWECDYSQANMDTLKIASKDVFTRKSMPDDICRQEKLLNNLLTAYERNESLPDSEGKQTVRNNLEAFLFTQKENDAKKINDPCKNNFIKECETKGIVRLANLAKNNWSCPEANINVSASNIINEHTIR